MFHFDLQRHFDSPAVVSATGGQAMSPTLLGLGGAKVAASLWA